MIQDGISFIAHDIQPRITDSSMNIFAPKDFPYPKLNQFVIYKCFILEFELFFSNFIFSDLDQFYYTLKCIAFCDDVSKITADNIEEVYESCMKIDKHTSSEFIKRTVFDDGTWYLRDKVVD